MSDIDDLEGLVHRTMDETTEDLESLIERHKSAVERFDLLGWPRPAVVLVSGSGLAVDVGEKTHGPVQMEFLLPFPTRGASQDYRACGDGSGSQPTGFSRSMPQGALVGMRRPGRARRRRSKRRSRGASACNRDKHASSTPPSPACLAPTEKSNQ